jgi:KipI family sensor histidine kinase inhibitor
MRTRYGDATRTGARPPERVVHRVGPDALLVEVGDSDEAAALFLEVRRRGLRAEDVVPAARTVLLTGVADPGRVAEEVRRWSLDDALGRLREAERPVLEVPTRFDGPDLADVARCWQVEERAVVDVLVGAELVVAFCGFAPGFAYCTGLPAGRSVPRLDTPRTRVPAGSIGLAGPYTGIYPSASPGGWRLVGRTALSLWDPAREEPATLAPGTRLRLVESDR